MPPRENLLATLAHPEFFETVDRYDFDATDYVDHATKLVPADWQRVRRGIWYSLAPPSGGPSTGQGWKLHLSAMPSHSQALLQRITPILTQAATPFKFLLDRRLLELSNNKNWSRGTSGKFVTVYPKDHRDFLSLAETLRDATREFQGPYILSDRRVPESSVLFYRYGAFARSTELTVAGERAPVYRHPDGQLVPDEREPYFRLPAWESDPFGVAEEDDEPSPLTLKQGRYRVISALGFRNSGGVYLAEDTTTQVPVIIKEARPHVYASPSHSSVDLLKKEFRLLSLLSDYAIAPEPLDLFTDWEHTFLVQRYIEGLTLYEHSARENPLIRAQPTALQVATYVRDTKIAFLHLARSLQTMHERHVVMADLSPNNVMLTSNTTTLIDFEAALQDGIDSTVHIATPSFAAPEQLAGPRSPTPASDRYAFGVTLLAFMCPITRMVHLKPSLLDELLSDLSVDLALPRTLTDLIHALVRENPDERPEWREVIGALQTNDSDCRVPVARAEVGRRWDVAAVHRICDYLTSSADYGRRDRLFPAHPSVFSTNPLSLAYGACGVAYALRKLTGECPTRIMEWTDSQECAPEEYPPGLYVGTAGIAWMMYELGREDRAVALMKATMEHPLLDHACDFLYGMAGTCLALLRFFCWTEDEFFLEAALRLGRLLDYRKGLDDGAVYWKDDDTVRFGFGRGASGVAHTLLYLALVSRDEKWLDLGRRALQFEYMNAAETTGGGWGWPADSENRGIVYQYWSIGGAGVGSVTGRYFCVTEDSQFGRALQRIVSEVDRKWAVYPTFANGLSGIGEFHLDMYDLLGDAQYMLMAKRAASAIALTAVDKPDGIAFPGDGLERFSCDLATGSAGIALFLGRLLGISTGGFLNLDFLIRDAQLKRGPGSAFVGK